MPVGQVPTRLYDCFQNPKDGGSGARLLASDGFAWGREGVGGGQRGYWLMVLVLNEFLPVGLEVL